MSGTPLHASIWMMIIPKLTCAMHNHCKTFKGREYTSQDMIPVISGASDLINEIDPGSAIAESTNVKLLFAAYATASTKLISTSRAETFSDILVCQPCYKAFALM